MKEQTMTERNSTPGRVSGPALALALPLALVALVALSLSIQARNGPFAGSSVIATAGQVSVGEQVGFAVYLVNSGPVTATDVLVWNPLPPGTTYLSASGGAFPVVGGAVNEVLSLPPESQAYDVQLHIPVLLTDTSRVTGIAWVGDVPPQGLQNVGLIVEVDNPAGRTLVDEVFVYDDRELVEQISGETWVRPHVHYFPLVVSRFVAPIPTPSPVPPAAAETMTFTIPYGQGLGFGGGSLHRDYRQALAGSDVRVGDNDVYLGQAPPSGPYLPWYAIGRAYGAWDTSALPDGAQILSAALVLDVGCNPPTSTFGTTVYRGLWTPPLTEAAWYSKGEEVVGTWDTADYPCAGCPAPAPCLVRIELDPVAVNREGLTLLEVRSDREGTPPTVPEQVLVNRSATFPALVVTYLEEQ